MSEKPSRLDGPVPPPRTRRTGCVWISLGIVMLLSIMALLLVWPRLRNWVIEAKQKRVESDLRSWAAVVHSYAEEIGSLPRETGPVEEVLYPLVVPRYMPRPFRYDYWGEPIEYAVSPDGNHFRIISRGWKGAPDFESSWTEMQPRTTTCWEDDMVLQDDVFIRYPEGPQRSCSLRWWMRFWMIPQPSRRARDEISGRD